jgi:DmsE family decaheme c-type cytochrome
VGEDRCRACHRAEVTQFTRTAHGRLANARFGERLTCESCHGPGKAHSDAVEAARGNDAAIAAASRLIFAFRGTVQSDTCTTCHNTGDQEFWEASQHSRRNLTCTTCHSMHNWNSLEHQLKADSVNQTCGNCHRDKLAKLDRSGHMPVREGKLTCSTCHNPHGSQNVRLLRVGNTVSESCTSCHAEKRGPFLWDHAPVRENCATCHEPHGSANERLLVAKLPFLCQRCHSHTRHPSTIYDNTVLSNANRLYNRACVNCHSNVHGSNHPSGHTYMR